ncbi:alpha/beta fold hydrolase [Alkalicoccus daliensis]|uniref:Pimeloyl-ACP methyl ester carboxylesterase n=1 Tax=Alkalicoccus daliensis TaxID=745820 RepID=A0A1H0EW39_9BACI|nr:alpha/beta hydrolase [Alkalicoccus daliensis]SDN86489.1 Pimeloyl-ACP methyl ester carboxylesterase [Alkalicoccus daliensis]
MLDKVKFEYRETNHITLHTAAAGPEDGPLVILLHGFPEFWYGWRKQIEPLAEAGYRVLIPDQRGYNLSDKPEGSENYKIDTLRDDILGLIKGAGREKAILIGHDWGGAVAWHTAATATEYVEKLIAVNIPYPGAMKQAALKYPPQLFKSSYMLFFQLPDIPEKLLQTNGWENMKQALTATAKPGAFQEEDLQKYKEAWAQPGSLTAMLNWYRALFQTKISSPMVQVPVRIIWGLGDQFLHPSTAKESLKYCLDGEMILVDEATHWVMHEQPAIVNRLIKEFLE